MESLQIQEKLCFWSLVTGKEVNFGMALWRTWNPHAQIIFILFSSWMTGGKLMSFPGSPPLYRGNINGTGLVEQGPP